MSSFDSEPSAKVLNNLPVIDTSANDLASLCMFIFESASGGKSSIIRESSLTFRDHAKCRTLTISPPSLPSLLEIAHVNRHGSGGKLVLHLKVRNDR